jgi:hypothetical protein
MLQLRLRLGTSCPPPHSLQTRHAIARSRALMCTPFARVTQPSLRLSYVLVHCLCIEPRAERLLSIPALAFVGGTDAFSILLVAEQDILPLPLCDFALCGISNFPLGIKTMMLRPDAATTTPESQAQAVSNQFRRREKKRKKKVENADGRH